MGLIGGYWPGLEKKKSKVEGYAWTRHNGQNRKDGNITGAESM